MLLARPLVEAPTDEAARVDAVARQAIAAAFLR
jgi:hypothetical protein